MGENLAQGPRRWLACTIYLLGGAIEVSVRQGHDGGKSPTRVLLSMLLAFVDGNFLVEGIAGALQ